MSLPKWIEDSKKLSETFGYKHDKSLIQALEIAWEALENTPADRIRNVWYVQKCKEAMRRIEEMGK